MCTEEQQQRISKACFRNPHSTLQTLRWAPLSACLLGSAYSSKAKGFRSSSPLLIVPAAVLSRLLLQPCMLHLTRIKSKTSLWYRESHKHRGQRKVLRGQLLCLLWDVGLVSVVLPTQATEFSFTGSCSLCRASTPSPAEAPGLRSLQRFQGEEHPIYAIILTNQVEYVCAKVYVFAFLNDNYRKPVLSLAVFTIYSLMF